MAGKPLDDMLTVDPRNNQIKSEVIQVIMQHLLEEGYTNTVHTLRTEAKWNNWASEGRKQHFKKATTCILNGDWEEVNRIITKSSFKSLKSLHYAIYKQQYLEKIESGDSTKALSIIRLRLKPLESLAPPGEFKVLTYLLACNSVRDATEFDNWREDLGRQDLVIQFKQILDPDSDSQLISSFQNLAPGRLWTLLKQASGFQLLSQPVSYSEKPVITSVVRDYEAPLCPNVEKYVFHNRSSVKSCGWLRGFSAVGCGLGDGTVCIWDVPTEVNSSEETDEDAPAQRPFAYDPEHATQLLGHEGRVWSITDPNYTRAATGGADGTVRVWDVDPFSEAATEGGQCKTILRSHEGDVYSVNKHPDGYHLISGGLDTAIWLYDLNKEVALQRFQGHTRPVTCVRFNHFGNILFSGSKDGTVKLWEVSSGVCLETIQRMQTKTAVSTLDLSPDGSTLLVGYQDSSVHFWDLTAKEPILLPKRLQGHVNTSRNLVKSTFGPGNLVFGGSEDGTVCVWSANSAKLLSRLIHSSACPNPEPVYDVRWNPVCAMLATCSDDHTVRIWECDRTKPYLPAC